MRTIVWFRGKDLRLSDHAPLTEAARTGQVIPLFVLDPYFFAPSRAQQIPHRIQFLLEGLRELEQGLAARGSRLLVVAGKSVEVVPRLAKQWKADRIVAHRWVEPIGRERDRRVSDACRLPFQLFEGEMLLPPGSLRTKAGRAYAVFTRFARAFHNARSIKAPLGAPRSLRPVPVDVRAGTTSIPSCKELGIPENPRLLRGGERAGKARLRAFLKGRVLRYDQARDRLDLDATSRLSADLKFGTLSVKTVWHRAEQRLKGVSGGGRFLDELIWREFSHSTLWDRPDLLQRPFQRRFENFPWHDDNSGWHAWAMGHTGYPVVDASARQLLAEGFVHNRARMISASFLTKHLLIDYRLGEAHYLRYLTDGDWAQNNLGWQWCAGSGCDAQPYFRVFNPVLQGERFDPKGKYVRRWVPELSQLPTPYIHKPWQAPEDVLHAAGVRLDNDYPRPIVDHQTARARFLATCRRHLKS